MTKYIPLMSSFLSVYDVLISELVPSYRAYNVSASNGSPCRDASKILLKADEEGDEQKYGIAG